MKNLINLILFALLLTSCATYKMEVQQGNALSNQEVALLKKGMSKDEVASLLGTPLLQDNFRSNRWDYVYYIKQGNSATRKRGITLFFQNDRLVEVKQ